jgi:hypothetical protein
LDNHIVQYTAGSGNSIDILVTASSAVNICAYNGYYLYVRYSLFDTTLSPTLSPTISVAPTLAPTPQPLTWEGGTNSVATGVSYSFDPSQGGNYDVTVEVYDTDFSYSTEYATVYVNGVMEVAQCRAGQVDCGSSFSTCLNNHVVQHTPGSPITILVTASSEVNVCPYNGYVLYVRYSLVHLGTSAPTVAPTSQSPGLTWEGGTNSVATGVSYSFDPSQGGDYDVTVEVYDTDFSHDSEYATVYVNGVMEVAQCRAGQVDCGSSFSTCLNNHVVQHTPGNPITILVTGSSNVNICPYNGYVLYVRYTLVHLSSSLVFEGGTNAVTTGISHSFNPYQDGHYNVHVEVYNTDFASTSEYSTVYVNGVQEVAQCRGLEIDCGSSFSTCLDNHVVPYSVSSGNSIDVLVTASSNVNFCPYNGYYLYVRFTLTKVRNFWQPNFVSFSDDVGSGSRVGKRKWASTAGIDFCQSHSHNNMRKRRGMIASVLHAPSSDFINIMFDFATGENRSVTDTTVLTTFRKDGVVVNPGATPALLYQSENFGLTYADRNQNIVAPGMYRFSVRVNCTAVTWCMIDEEYDADVQIETTRANGAVHSRDCVNIPDVRAVA